MINVLEEVTRADGGYFYSLLRHGASKSEERGRAFALPFMLTMLQHERQSSNLSSRAMQKHGNDNLRLREALRNLFLCTLSKC